MLTKTKMVKVFVAYAEKDVLHFKSISRRLEPLKRHNKIQISDMHATTSPEGRGVRLDEAELIIALITPNFLTSQSCHDVEAVAMHKHLTKSIPIIPVLMEDSDLSKTHFSGLEPLPTQGRSVASSSNREEALQNIEEGLKELIYSF